MTQPIWITGVGTCTGLGHCYEQFADSLLAGRSAIRRVSRFDIADHPSQIAGQLDQVPVPRGDDPVAFAALPRLEQLIRWCCRSALEDSGLWEKRGEVRIGMVLGVGAEWLLFWENDALAGGRRLWEPEHDTSSTMERTRMALGLTGPIASVSAACASGNIALGLARNWLRMGWVDVCLAGACDMCVAPMALAGFGNLRALSRRNDSPESASRPFDRDRDGFVMSEGGAVFVLEHADRARGRGAVVHAEVAGIGASSDAHHMIIPSPDPTYAVASMRQALADAGENPSSVDYINAHATSTSVGDISETRVLTEVFGDDIARIPVSATKSMTGHLLTAAAAVEALACLVAMRREAIPPTINLENPDPECTLCHVAQQARPARVKVAVSNSFGFGGSNTSLVLRAA